MLWLEKLFIFAGIMYVYIHMYYIIYFFPKYLTKLHLASQKKNVYSICALNLHLRLWTRHDPIIYNNLQDKKLHIPVDTQPSKRLLKPSYKNSHCFFKWFEHCFKRISFKYKNSCSMKRITQTANQWIKKHFFSTLNICKPYTRKI